ncbi:MAG: metallopeptidase family protein [Candidatus Methylacidiphilales bacterium]|nr:metallopeptidase family protein [Candidatus Methylacidiphilales bacterium]
MQSHSESDANSDAHADANAGGNAGSSGNGDANAGAGSYSQSWDGFTLPDPSESGDHWKRLESMAREVSEEFLAELPEDLRVVSDEVGIQIEVRPESGRGFRPNLLGVFLGLKREDARAGHSVIPPQICLFVENLWWQAGYNEERFRDEVRLTLYHELGHYLGLDEGDLIRRGLG